MRTLSTIVFFILLSSLGLAACRSRERVSEANVTATYDVVSEGDASGIASTINGPGEVAPPAMTSTNVDTTTNLAITGQPTVPTATNGNLAEALPATAAAPRAPVYTTAPNPPVGIMRRTPIPATQTTPPLAARPEPAQPVLHPQPVPPAETAPPPTDTASPPADTAPPPADMSQTDTSHQAPAPGKNPKDKKKDEPPPPPPPEQTDTTATNPGR